MPYPLRESKNGYAFTTDKGATYELAFRDDADYFPEYPDLSPILSFAIDLQDGEIGPKDARLELTVYQVFQLTFEAYPQAIITYTCSTENQQSRQRNVLFRRWFGKYGAGFSRIEHSNPAIQEYSVALFKVDHPLRYRIEEAVEDTFQDK